jgi:hypothetical protein
MDGLTALHPIVQYIYYELVMPLERHRYWYHKHFLYVVWDFRCPSSTTISIYRLWLLQIINTQFSPTKPMLEIMPFGWVRRNCLEQCNMMDSVPMAYFDLLPVQALLNRQHESASLSLQRLLG